MEIVMLFLLVISIFFYFDGYNTGKDIGKAEAELEQARKDLDRTFKEFEGS